MTTTIDEFQIAPLFRVANTLGNPLRKAVIELAPDALRSAAEKQTGLSDWGSEDFWPGFETLARAFAADETQTIVGRASLRIEMLHRLKNRLRLEAAVKREPAILQSPVRRPLFIIGFPRTGTTLLHKLLAQDPNVHVPLQWKLYSPLPMNVPQEEIERRIREANSLLRFAAMIAPQWSIIHPTNAEEPEECIFLLTDNLTYVLRANIPAYVEKYLHTDLKPVYENFRQHLQALQWQQPERSWTLKSPLHLWGLQALLATFPDARIIQTHRDPKKALPSWFSLAAALGKMHRRSVDMEQIAKDWLPLWKIGMERAQAVRASANPDQFLDLHYKDLIADPLAAVRQIYKHFGDELTPEAEASMTRWLKDHAHGAHEKHRYSAAQYGVSDEQITSELSDYIAAFNVPVE
jgi:hypothetical protein